MGKGIITLDDIRNDEILKITIVEKAEQCNLDLEKVYGKLLVTLVDYNDVEYVNRRLPQLMSDFIFGYQMCYNPHVKYKCNSYFEKGYS